jgi:hypothetical protein
MASLSDAQKVYGGRPLPQNPPFPPQVPQHSIAQDMYQHIFDRGMVWCVGRINPFRSADSGACRLLLQMLQFFPCFAVATSLTPLGWSARSSI